MNECPACGGDGRETCDNSDHGFVDVVGGRLGCPVCGHDPDHKVPDGGVCYMCSGSGEITDALWQKWKFGSAAE